MHIVVATTAVAGSLKANAINTFKMAGGFAKLGHRVTIVCTHRWARKKSNEALAIRYGFHDDISWIQIPKLPLIPHINRYWVGAMGVRPLVKLKPDLVFARAYIIPVLSCKLNLPTVAESHAHPGNKSPSFLHFVNITQHRAFKLLVTISEHLAANFKQVGVPEDKLLILPDAVDLDLFLRPTTLPPTPFVSDGPNVTYAGHLYDYKGIPTIIDAAELMPEISFHLVGGWPQDIKRHRRTVKARCLNNITFHGLHSHAEVPPFLWHSDVLLLSPTAHHPSALWTSPVKLGEYLASGTPVVASDMDALRAWLTDDDVNFVRPDSGAALAEGIQQVLNRKELASSLSQAGKERAQTLSYKARAGRILKALGM